MILPITAFSPGGEPDFRAETSESPQANVVHGCELCRLLQAGGMTLIFGSPS